ncbi:hypothetical protein JM654_08110 [Microbacterium oxydans]|jgi:hypothetical protein|nr:hypothetical protein [Microbacterium oxydans]
MTRRLAIVWNPSKTDKDTLNEGLTASLQDDTAPEVSRWETTEDDPDGDATCRPPHPVATAGQDQSRQRSQGR